MPDQKTIRIYDQRASDYAKLTDDHNAADPRLLAFIAACPAAGRVLDLGCGPGTAAAAMARAGLRVEAIDAASKMVALAACHPGVTARQARFEDISGVNIYDGIWASFSLLHAPRAAFPDHLAALHLALKSGGAFYIAMKLGTDAARDKIGRHYTYYAQQELDTYLTEAGFSVLDHVLGNSVGLDGSRADWVSVAAHG